MIHLGEVAPLESRPFLMDVVVFSLITMPNIAAWLSSGSARKRLPKTMKLSPCAAYLRQMTNPNNWLFVKIQSRAANVKKLHELISTNEEQ